MDFPDWREDVINGNFKILVPFDESELKVLEWPFQFSGFVQLLLKEVNDTFPSLLDNGLRMLLQLLTSWKNSLTSASHQPRKDSLELVSHSPGSQRTEPSVSVLRFTDGFALAMLCNCRLTPRRLAVHILKEVKAILKLISTKNKEAEPSAIDIIDKICPSAVERCLSHLPAAEKVSSAFYGDMSCTLKLELRWICVIYVCFLRRQWQQHPILIYSG